MVILVWSWWGPTHQHRNESHGAWSIVRQRDRPDNYGYVTELGNGFVHAGFSNKESAVSAMREARFWYRHPPTPPQAFWEAVK